MLRALYDWVTSALTITREVEQLRRELRDVRVETVEIQKELAAMRFEMEAHFARETAEREKFMLQVQNLLLQWEKRLPLPSEAKPLSKPRRRGKRKP